MSYRQGERRPILLPKFLHQRLKMASASHDMPLREITEAAIRDWLRAHPIKPLKSLDRRAGEAPPKGSEQDSSAGYDTSMKRPLPSA